MNRAIVLIWLGAGNSYPSHEPDLESWAASRQVTLETPSSESALESASAEAEAVTRIESLLADARAESYGTDPNAAESALQNAELLLRGHPSLPQAAWLMAETCRAHAALVRETDPALAAILVRRAEVLEGPRAAALGSEAPVVSSPRSREGVVGSARSAPEEAAGSPPAAPESSSPVPLVGPLSNDEVAIDGAVTAEPRVLSPGEHHVRVLRRGRLAWSGWVVPEGSPIVIPLPAVVPCSDTDFERVRLDGDRVHVRGPVLCDRWAVARETGTERIEVARCEHAQCGTLLPWSRTWGADLEGPMHPPWPPPHDKSWIPWTMLSAVAVVAGGIVLVSSGAFDKKGPPHDTLTFTGPGAR